MRHYYNGGMSVRNMQTIPVVASSYRTGAVPNCDHKNTQYRFSLWKWVREVRFP